MPDTSNENIMINRLKILSMQMKLKVDGFLWERNVKWNLSWAQKRISRTFVCLFKPHLHILKLYPIESTMGKKSEQKMLPHIPKAPAAVNQS